MMTSPAPNLVNVKVSEIKVVNPRQRNAAVYAQIVENIRTVGLKRPITVTKRLHQEGPWAYDLVCGQGRLEAYQLLGEAQIPAVVIDATAEDSLIMSLIENVARKPRSALETMREIKALRDRGHTHERIAKMIGAVPSWVTSVLGLLENGEERLVASVASGVMPIGVATVISRGTPKDLQVALAEAYEAGTLRGRQLATVRNVIRLRESSRLIGPTNSKGSSGQRGRDWTPEGLLKVFEEEAGARRLAVKKAELVAQLLTFTVAAFKKLMEDPTFVAALEAEDLASMPAALGDALGTRETVQ